MLSLSNLKNITLPSHILLEFQCLRWVMAGLTLRFLKRCFSSGSIKVKYFVCLFVCISQLLEAAFSSWLLGPHQPTIPPSLSYCFSKNSHSCNEMTIYMFDSLSSMSASLTLLPPSFLYKDQPQ